MNESLNDLSRRVVIDYTNWRGERALRPILPIAIAWGATEWHPKPQWLLWARDASNGKLRGFAMASIHSLTPAAE